MTSIIFLDLPKIGHSPDAALVSLTDYIPLIIDKVRVSHSYHGVQ